MKGALLLLLALLAVGDARPGAKDCTELWITQDLDHFSFGADGTFEQRYLVNAEHASPTDAPIFLYVGNEAPVDLYADNAGLMWENAEEFGALLVFAEHRYYGQSLPYDGALTKPNGMWDPEKLRFLSHEQALADYATLVYRLREDKRYGGSPVIAFGGSYGGMLASWMRQKYPGAVAGAVAASAPVLAFPGMSPSFDSESYWATVTRTAERSAPGCANAVRAGFAALRAVSLAHVQDAVGACQPVTSEAERERWAVFLAVAWDTMAMGSYPYPTNYMTGGGDNPPLPAWPVRAACEAMMAEDVRAGPTGALGRLTKASGVFNNATGTVGECYELPSDDEYDGIWDYQWCTELMPQETYFAMDGVSDMFWPRSDSGASVRNRCERRFGILPRRRWIAASTGGGPRGLAAVTRVVYSNGDLDPWSSGGVRSSLGPETVAVDIPEGGHHADLFFAHPEDPPSLIAARVTTMALVRDWIVQFRREAALATGAPTSAIATE